jgi:L-methionine (R)-S-oxide reductase
MTQKKKVKMYLLASKQIDSVLEGESYKVLKMATINCILKDNLPYYFWTGFYLVRNGELIVGPYQGTLGCLHIPFGKGVCGTAAKRKKTQVVMEVNKFPGHIACDSMSQSEIGVPVFNNKKDLIAVFDVDSVKKGSFDATDQRYLEAIMQKQFSAPLLEN